MIIRVFSEAKEEAEEDKWYRNTEPESEQGQHCGEWNLQRYKKYTSVVIQGLHSFCTACLVP